MRIHEFGTEHEKTVLLLHSACLSWRMFRPAVERLQTRQPPRRTVRRDGRIEHTRAHRDLSVRQQPQRDRAAHDYNRKIFANDSFDEARNSYSSWFFAITGAINSRTVYK